ncbi:MAG: hypothetical protein U5J82_02430 [Desulfobacterales bacterium]|nr:hypothetical protein [Desulfobacterales bacterium]
MDIRTLRLAGREVPDSFELTTGQDTVLRVAQVLRLLPGKRLVALAQLGGRKIIAKLFYAGRRAQRHAQREKVGLLVLAAKGVPAPTFLDMRPLGDDAWLVEVQYLSPAESAGSRWRRVTAEGLVGADPLAALMPLVELMGQMHAAGLCQKDLHLDNFLWHAGILKVIDGGSVQTCKRRRKIEGNLGLLLAQLPLTVAFPLQPVLSAYQRGNPKTTLSPAQLERVVARQRQRRVRNYLKKTMRDCQEFLVARAWRRFTVVARAEAQALSEVLADPDTTMGLGIPLKLGNTSTVVRFNLGGRELVIKR